MGIDADKELHKNNLNNLRGLRGQDFIVPLTVKSVTFKQDGLKLIITLARL